jgi:transposase
LLSYDRTNLLELAAELDITPKILCNWRRIYKEFGKGSFPGFGNLRVNPEKIKVIQLEKKNLENLNSI